MNNVVIIGKNVRDVELKYTQGGQAIANITVAVDKGLSKQKREEFESQNKQTADFIPVVAWGGTAEYLGNYLKKGKMVAVQGSIQTGSYDHKDGYKVYTTDINARNVKILEWENDNQGSGQVSQDFHPIDNQDIPF